jgi:hypothetical protein
MQQPTSKQLFAYWDHIRNGRIAPRRFEIEPAKIAGILRETFIAECTGLLGFRFRLAGTQICQHFGRELRGVDFLSLWSLADRDAIASLVRNILNDGAVGHGTFLAHTETDREASFEFTLMPLVHTGSEINRLLGSITAIEPPFWLGTEPLTRLEVMEVHLLWPDGSPAFMKAKGADVVRLARKRFRVLDGGLSQTPRT